MRTLAWLLVAGIDLCLTSAVANAQPTLLVSARKIDWSSSGATSISNARTQCGTTIAAYTGAASVINTALAECGANHYVRLGPGTFTLSSGITFGGVSNVTLIGAGADQTSLIMDGSVSCNGLGVSLCASDGYLEMNADPATNVTNWTAGYAKGTTAVTLASVANLAVGSLIALFQDNDASDPGDTEFICSVTGTCSNGSFGGGGCTVACSPRREQGQWALVTAINGNIVTIADPLIANNWRSGQNPKAAYLSSVPIAGVGIEALSITHCTGCYGIAFMYAADSWVKGVRSINPGRNHVDFFECAHCEVRDSYLYEGQTHGSTSYGVECIMGSMNRIENNIVTNVTAPFIFTGSCSGNVVSYNYSKNDTYTVSAWQQPDHYYHGTGSSHNLHEGNVGVGGILDNVHGPSSHITFFRNYFKGVDDDCAGSACTSQTNPLHIYSQSRFVNAVGNVLGVAAYHVGYEAYTGHISNCYTAIYQLDFSGNACNTDTYASDSSVRDGTMRWGNWDVVTNAVRWCGNSGSTGWVSTCSSTSEVPTGLSIYANTVPATETLPASFYLTVRPSWWANTKVFPAIGPDVSGGSVSGVGGHAYTIPAQDCYTTTMHGPSDGTGPVLTFNAARCYDNVNKRRFLILRR